MASQDGDSSNMFTQKLERRLKISKPGDTADGDTQLEGPTETITVKDFFDFMKTAYQVYEHLEGDEAEGTKIDWEELTKLTVINHVIDQNERDLLSEAANMEPKAIASKSESSLCVPKSMEKPIEKRLVEKRSSCNDIDGKRGSHPDGVEMLGVWTEANLNCKLNDVVNEGILDSILPYLVGYKKPTKTTSVYHPIIKKGTDSDVKKLASFGGFVNEKESRDRLGRRKSSVIMAQEQRLNSKHDGEVEIHVCDEVKGLKKDFRCPQKLLVSKMGYFADVTAGQKLEDMDISVHCDIQIFDWLMRWVKRDSILVADWPLLEPSNVVPILVSASFLQMEPLLHDCLIYCHAHMNEIVKTSTNLACLSDALLTRLAAMYTNAELESIRDRRDKVQSRLYCKMILSLAEPVPETLRGHYATLATLFKCSKCNKLLGRHIAEQVPCQPASMKIDRRGNMIAMHTKDTLWSLNEYISWLYGELRSWRRVYWRLWADCHLLRCQICESYFPAYQMEWCSHHEQGPHMFALEGRPPLPAGRYPCCGERAYRFETITRNTGCQFREHAPDERLPNDAAVMDIYSRFREIIAMRPPQLVFPERLTRLITREPGEELHGRLQCKEVFWWEGIQLVPARPPLGLLGKLYTSNNKFNPPDSTLSAPPPHAAQARPGSAAAAARASEQSLNAPPPPGVRDPSPERTLLKPPAKEDAVKPINPTTILVPVTRLTKKGGAARAQPAGDSGSEQSSSSDSDESSASVSPHSEEEAPQRRPGRRVVPKASPIGKKRARVVGRQWVSALSARSNQDGQRRFEERAARQMRQALARRAALSANKARSPPGGVYARLEAEWRERHGTRPPRAALSARQRQPLKYK